MEDVRARLAEWQDHGLISFEQAAHIEGREGQRRPATAARADELLCYIGSGLLVFGAFWIAVDLGELFGENNEWKAFFVVAAASVFASLAGGYLLRSMDPAARRGAGWVLGLAVLSGAVALGILLGLIAETGDNTLLLVGLGTALYGFAAWRFQPSVPTQLALFVGVLLTLIGILVVALNDLVDALFFSGFETFSTWVGLVLAAFGAAWIWLAHRQIIFPANAAYALGSITLITATLILYGIAAPWLIAEFAAAAWLIWLGSTTQHSVLIAFGGLAGFIATITLLVEVFDEPNAGVGWTAAIIGLGLLAVAASVVSEQAVVEPPPSPPATVE